MKAILTVGIVLGLLMTSANLEVTAQERSKSPMRNRSRKTLRFAHKI